VRVPTSSAKREIDLEDVTGVSEPSGAVSFFDVIKKQLGLKVVKKKHPEPVLVIDHINEQPTEN
jgi:uncharacterized protein (TIGR03435 family)